MPILIRDLFPTHCQVLGESKILGEYLGRIPINEVPLFGEQVNKVMQNCPQTNFNLLVNELSQAVNSAERLHLFQELMALTQNQPNDDASYTLIELRLIDKAHRPHFVAQVLRLLRTLSSAPLAKDDLGTLMFHLREISSLEREGVVNRILDQVICHPKEIHYGMNDLLKLLETKGEAGYFRKKQEHLLHKHHVAL